MDSTTWAALTAVLTALGAVWTWTAYRRRGAASGTRALAWTLVPLALGLTGTLRLAGDLASDVSSWAARLVFSPLVWLGVMVGGLSAVLFVVSGWMLGRASARTPKVEDGGSRRQVEDGGSRKQVAAPEPKRAEPALDDDVAAILRKHGIS